MIEYDGDVAQYDEYKAAWNDILNALGSGKGAIMPRSGATFNIKDPPRGGTNGDPASQLSDACDSGQSIRVLGATLTNKIGNVGSFSASTNHTEVKYSKEENDAGRMWESIDTDLSAPLVMFNAVAIADALRSKGYKTTPGLAARRVPRGKHRVPRTTDPEVEARLMSIYVNELGLELSAEGVHDRIDMPRAIDESDIVKGKAQTVAKGGALMTPSEALDGPAVNEDPAAEAAAAQAENDAAQGAGDDDEEE
jgi:phage gp29-like protein